MRKLPFSAKIFWTVLAVVAVLVVLTFVVLARYTEYERTTTDVVGSTISSILFAYLLHLWLLPADYLHQEEDFDEYAEEDGDGRHAPGDSAEEAEDEKPDAPAC